MAALGGIWVRQRVIAGGSGHRRNTDWDSCGDFLSVLPTVVALLGTLLIVLLSVWLAGVVTRQIGIEDHPSIVIDEIAGYVLTMTMIPLTWWTVIAGFLIFRLLDIYKPPPAGWLDRNCTGGFGITADDVVAGIYANLIMHGLLYFVGLI